MPRASKKLKPGRTTALHMLLLILLVSPFYLNDFANIFIKDWRLWLFIDYVGVKLFPLAVTLWSIRSKTMLPMEFGLTTQRISSFLVVFLVATLAGTVIDQNGYQLIGRLPGYAPLGGMPVIKSPAWNWIDLTVGLPLVGAVEELVFRGYMRAFIGRYTESWFAIVAISSAAFGVIHWSLGLHAVVITSIIGAVFMIGYLSTGALPPIMLAHFAVNFIDFAGVIPKTIFKLT
jgi:membrane protease YdiL (CAAX protease family)